MTKTHSKEHRRSMQNWFLVQYLEISFFHRPERQTVAAVSLLLTECHVLVQHVAFMLYWSCQICSTRSQTIHLISGTLTTLD